MSLGVHRLDSVYRQAGSAPVAMEAEESTRIVAPTGKGLVDDPLASNGRCLAYVTELENRVAIETPGEYAAWYRAWFPVKGGWCHQESMDQGEAVQHTDSAQGPDREWLWVRGPTYRLTKGEHRWLFPKPYAWCGGARLDKLVLAPTSAPMPVAFGPAPTCREAAESAMFESSRIMLRETRAWSFSVELQPASTGTVTIDYSLDRGLHWQPWHADASVEQPTRSETVQFRFLLRRGADGSSPGFAQAAVTLYGRTPAAEVGEWQSMRPLPVATTGHSAAAVEDWLYVLGGVRGITLMWAPLDAAGQVGPWREGRLPDWLALQGARAVTVGRRIYMVGGRADAVRRVNVAFADARPDGSLTEWTPSSNVCPASCGGAAVVGSNLYYVGGWYARRAWVSSLADDGQPGPWRDLCHLVSPRGFLDLLAVDGRLYAVGGSVGHTAAQVKPTVYRAVASPQGSVDRWDADEPLPVATASYAGTVVGDTLLVAGGLTPGGRSSEVWVAQPGPDGALPSWSARSPLPQPVEGCAAVYARGHVYVIGGMAGRGGPDVAGALTNSVYAAAVK